MILGRVRAAVADVPADEPATWRIEDHADPAVAYARAPRPDGPAGEPTLARLAERIDDDAARVTRVAGPDDVAAAVAGILERQGARTLAPPCARRWRRAGR